MFEVADIHEAMRVLSCSYDEAVEWLEAEVRYLEQEYYYDEQYIAQSR